VNKESSSQQQVGKHMLRSTRHTHVIHLPWQRHGHGIGDGLVSLHSSVQLVHGVSHRITIQTFVSNA
jgi:hypothetical protein